MSPRASIFGSSAGEDDHLDLGGFAPRPRESPDVGAVRKVSELNNFPSRQAIAEKPDPLKRPLRRRRTGRNVQINIKASQETIDMLYRISDANGWVLGETLQRAVAALDAALAREEGSETVRGGRS